ncbi:DUF4097 family beta strand repeat-containing protein [Fodinibius sediminis]|uniref:Adhesin n=1 Tax=Fodinibius sediminis TaxID=1214077 RepID=A0A521APJ4_9BACT|nr:DUF4097 family beta strand repeat-containing protein [Fodinibius sediminis]SMO36722.1 Putative adhesin [Fodinibius sediminis]
MDTRNSFLLKITLTFLLSFLVTFWITKPAKADGNAGNSITVDEPYRTETFNATGSDLLDIKTSGGHITVEGSNSNAVRIEMYVQKNGRDLSPDDTDLANWDIDISQSGNTITAHARRKKSGWNIFGSDNRISISFVIHAPREIETDLATSGGHLEGHGLAGTHTMKTSGGHITLSDIEGRVKARTSGGHISVNSLDGDLDAQTSGGHIHLEDIRGTSVQASTSGGNIEADFLALGSVIDLKTSGGNVNLQLPERSAFDLDLKGNLVNATLDNFSGKAERDEIKGKVNGGGPSVSAKTSGGIVSLSFKS